MNTNNQPAIIVIEHGGETDENKFIGPFTNGDAASDWAFKNLEHGTQWYWLPLDAPTTK